MINNFQGSNFAAFGKVALGLIAVVSIACHRDETHEGALQGVIELDERALGFEVGGRLLRVAAVRGRTVQAGDELAVLDDALVRAALESRTAEAQAAQARADLTRAGSRVGDVRAMSARLRAAEATESVLKRTLERERALLASGALPQAAFDQTESRLSAASAEREAIAEQVRVLRAGARTQEIDSATAQAAAAQAAVGLETARADRHVLRAAIAGRVLDVHADPGEIVTPGAPVVTLADTTHPYTDVFIPTQKLANVRVGMPASLVVDASRKIFRGSVESISRETEFTPRYLFSDKERTNLVVRVRIRLEDPEQHLYAGLPAFVTLSEGGGSTP